MNLFKINTMTDDTKEYQTETKKSCSSDARLQITKKR